MLLNLAAERRVLFLGGKGGVGKTTVASALALHAAREGRRALVVSTDPAHNLGHLWDQKVGDRLTRLGDGAGGRLSGIEIDPDASTDQHLKDVARTLRKLMPENLAGEVDKHMELSRRSPGTHEAAVLERMTELVETGMDRFDLVVFDTAPSGHTARLMALPELMTAWTDGLLARREKSQKLGAAMRGLDGDRGKAVLGSSAPRDPVEERDEEIRSILLRRRDRLAGLREVLTDRARTSFAIVLAAERLPVLETIALHEELTRTGVDVGGLVVNKRSPADRGDFLARRHAVEEEHLGTLRTALPEVPLQQIPLKEEDVVGPAALERFARKL
ncbi:ArsA family ATPase [Brachybacterium fresconis]|uniref:Arsenite-transporting ATPase n=1 Tax=Brachybacterium fresconis TaxID=173363 RepID=A0ABS4YNH8_9MICO|nr:ArsA family ATPase [Brachybacterium fresconis]MBP2410318.1 arsenite-transporting ATPase [Brachybacterium fresconis]